MVIKGTMAGRHHSPFYGYSSEFSQYRNYVPGDNLRYFDWKAYAKTERPTIRQFQDETNANVYLVLDSSASMLGADKGSLSKWDYIVVLAGALSMLGYKNRDSLSLAYGAGKPDFFTPPKNNPAHIKYIHKTLESIQPAGQTDLLTLFRLLAPRLRSFSLTYVFTDCWQPSDAIIRGLKAIRSKSQSLTLVQILTQQEEQFFKGREFLFKDMETQAALRVSATHLQKEYLQRLADHKKEIMQECRRMKVRYVNVNTSDPMVATMRRILGVAGSDGAQTKGGS